MTRRLVLTCAVALLLLPAPAGAETVVDGHFVSFSADRLTITYRSDRGRFKAHLLGYRHFRLTGRIDGKRLRGEIRTRPHGSSHYRARGSGRFGGRRVRITGGGPDSLRSARLVLH